MACKIFLADYAGLNADDADNNFCLELILRSSAHFSAKSARKFILQRYKKSGG
jgi:hypothetical protein